MGKLSDRISYGAIGVAGGLTGLASPAGLCTTGACTACLRCAGLGVVLVALAIWKKMKGVTADGLAQSSN